MPTFFTNFNFLRIAFIDGLKKLYLILTHKEFRLRNFPSTS
jgi:hypothetical protein